jgi:hypothetical protein
MISSYLERPLRTLEQALADRARAPGSRSAQPAGPDLTGPGSVELLVRLLTENTDKDGALEAPAFAAAGQRSPLDRRRAA